MLKNKNYTKMNESKLRQAFKNKSDCNANTGYFDNFGNYHEGRKVKAITEERFIELLKSAKLLKIN